MTVVEFGVAVTKDVEGTMEADTEMEPMKPSRLPKTMFDTPDDPGDIVKAD